MHEIIALHVGLGCWRETDRRCIINDDVDSAELIYGILDGWSYLSFIANINDARKGSASGTFDLLSCGVDGTGKFWLKKVKKIFSDGNKENDIFLIKLILGFEPMTLAIFDILKHFILHEARQFSLQQRYWHRLRRLSMQSPFQFHVMLLWWTRSFRQAF